MLKYQIYLAAKEKEGIRLMQYEVYLDVLFWKYDDGFLDSSGS